MYTGPVVDCHTHPEYDEDSRVMADPHPAAAYHEAAQGLDVRHAAALAMALKPDPVRTRELNDLVLALVARDPLFYALCSVHPGEGDEALGEVARVAEQGARGLKLHPISQEFDVADPAVTEIVRRAADAGLPVLFDAYSPWDGGQLGKFADLAIAVPEARIVLAHALGSRFADLLLLDVLASYPWWTRNVWVDVSAVACMFRGSPYTDQLHWVLSKVGTDRLLFGSDWPLYGPREALEAVAELGFTDDELTAICHTNAAELYDLG